MKTIRVELNAKLRWQLRSDEYTTSEEEVARVNGTLLNVSEYPRVGDDLTWEDGTTYRVTSFAWMIDGRRTPGVGSTPIVEVG